MNTRKQVFLMSLLLMAMLVVVGIYAAWYPSREADATDYFAEQTAERGAILFARNCRLCHGDVAEGGALGGRLTAAPALDRADLQGFIDSKATLSENINSRVTEIRVSNTGAFKNGQRISIDDEQMEIHSISENTLSVKRAVEHSTAASHIATTPVLVFDQPTLDEQVDLINNTISCGRVGTAMPAWAQNQGGTLSDEQIRQLMVVITENRWDLVEEEVDVEDAIPSHLTEPLNGSGTFMFVNDVTPFTNGEAIRISDERLRVVSRPDKKASDRDKSGIIEVERGILDTTPLEHDVEEEIFRFPEVATPSINASSCGQTARPAGETVPPGLIETFDGQTTVEVVAQAVAFNLREIQVSAATGPQVRIRLDNRDADVEHNIAFYASSTNTTAALAPSSIGTTFEGSAVDDTVFNIPSTGSYFFRCDVHPTTMTGTFTVTQ